MHVPGRPLEGTEIFNMDFIPLQNRNVIRPNPNLGNVKDIMDKSFYGLEIRLDFRFVIQEEIDMKLEFNMSATR